MKPEPQTGSTVNCNLQLPINLLKAPIATIETPYLKQLDLKDPKFQLRVSAELPLKFHPGISILVGPNGSGKSTVLNAISRLGDEHFTKNAGTCYEASGQVETRYLNGAYNLQTKFSANQNRFGVELASRVVSHGESSKFLNRGLEEIIDQFARVDGFLPDSKMGLCILIDEPDSLGLDFKSILELKALLVRATSLGIQTILATHSPLLWQIPGANIIPFGDNQNYFEEVLQEYRTQVR